MQSVSQAAGTFHPARCIGDTRANRARRKDAASRLLPNKSALACHVRFNVIDKPKEAVLDPQGNAIREAMRHLGMPEVQSVRIGKYMEIKLDSEDVDVEKRLHNLCRDLLSNPVIEDYELQKPNGKNIELKQKRKSSK